ncbi:sensor histidine kinase [Micromonospora sp. C95]|uniref:sensor histidine kinase n=1 Tax=Micromonospora sp. C95 TaxID=2824882 RepID=UPI001B39B105|nr:histidine kinase [Micromonospora sp. C95]MBQ1027026.1 two-component sensor histidine kinase [Micromonospora sp. C95]
MAPDGRPTWRPWLSVVAVSVPVALLLCLMTAGTVGPAGTLVLTLITTTAVAALLWAVIGARQQRRVYEDRLTAWAAERAAAAERLRIARELHDLVSHGLGLVTVRAATAARVTGSAGEAERAAALSDIEQVGRETTAELRRMLDVLRAPGAEPAPLRPPDTLDALPEIVRSTTAAGTAATVEVRKVGEVPPGVQLAVCAIVREGLSNTARHAGPTCVHVTVDRDGDAIVVEVRDTGPSPGWRPRPGAGHGLDGLRERVSMLDGALRAGPAGPGFQLTARLPARRSG